MTLHPRHCIVEKAYLDISDGVRTAVLKYDLTYGELMGVILEVGMSWNQLQIKDERERFTVVNTVEGD